MAGDFRRIFSRIGVGRTEDGYQYFVDDFSFCRMDFTEGEGLGLALVQGLSTDGREDS